MKYIARFLLSCILLVPSVAAADTIIDPEFPIFTNTEDMPLREEAEDSVILQSLNIGEIIIDEFDLPWLAFIIDIGQTAFSCVEWVFDTEAQLSALNDGISKAKAGKLLLPIKIRKLKSQLRNTIHAANQAYLEAFHFWSSQGFSDDEAKALAMSEMGAFEMQMEHLKQEIQQAKDLLESIENVLPILEQYRDALRERIAACQDSDTM